MKNTRREALRLCLLGSVSAMALPTNLDFITLQKPLERIIPSTGEALPAVGLGTWQTFDANNATEELQVLKQVLLEMAKRGGKVIDSSPMYGSSEAVVGKLTSQLENPNSFFYATKVWISGQQAGIEQMNDSFVKMKRKTMDLMQIHNLVDWKTHIKTLRQWKDEGKIRYWGLTHYVDSAHETLEKIIRQERPDFIQFNYSILSRHAEKSLFNTIEKYDTAVLINQPYESGNLFRKVKGKVLPDFCAQHNIESWGQYFLKFILSNDAVTCVIPGTSNPKHLIDNMAAAYGPLPDKDTRELMATYIKSL